MSELGELLRGVAHEHLERHKPEPGGGCTCGFCVYSAEHVLMMFVQSESDLLRLLEAGQKMNDETYSDHPGDYANHCTVCAARNEWDAALAEMKGKIR